MKIGLILPSLLATKRFDDRIFAPKELLATLADGLVKKGHQVFVYGSPNINTKAEIISLDSLLETQDFISDKDSHYDEVLSKHLSFVRTMNEYEIAVTNNAFNHANKTKLDILHCYLGYYAHYFVDLSTVPVVFTLHDPVFPQISLEYQRLKHFPDHKYIAISNDQKNEYKRLLGIDCIDVIYHGLVLVNFTFSLSPGNQMIFYGRFVKAKGVEHAIEAAKRTGFPLKLASSKNYRETEYYKHEVKPKIDSKLITEIDFLGPKARDEFLGQAKVALFPIQWSEPFGMTLIESMACGTPVVAFAKGSVPEIVKDGVTGFIVNPEAGVSGLVDAVKKIYSMSEAQYQEMRKNCRMHIEEKFTSDLMVEKHLEIYKKII